ncbi:Acetyl-coenzyme A synthetase, partial [Frankliniella fusca]
KFSNFHQTYLKHYQGAAARWTPAKICLNHFFRLHKFSPYYILKNFTSQEPTFLL